MFNLKRFRDVTGLTQAQVARMLNCTQANVSKAEIGYGLTPDNIAVLQENYPQLDFSDFEDGSPSPREKNYTSNTTSCSSNTRGSNNSTNISYLSEELVIKFLDEIAAQRKQTQELIDFLKEELRQRR